MKWSCDYCSSVNEAKSKTCFVCGHPRPTKAVIKRRAEAVKEERPAKDRSKEIGMMVGLLRRMATLTYAAGILMALAAVVICLIGAESREALVGNLTSFAEDIQMACDAIRGEALQDGQLHTPLVSLLAQRWNFRVNDSMVNWKQFTRSIPGRIDELCYRSEHMADRVGDSVAGMISYVQRLIDRVM